MNSLEFIDRFPLPLLFVATTVSVFLPILGGAYLGRRFRRDRGDDNESSSSTIVGALLGLLAFLLAFTFGAAGSRFDARKQLVLEEVNNIGTASLRADFLPLEEREEVRRLFREYVELRLEVFEQPERIEEILAESELIHETLWAQATRLGGEVESPVLLALYIQSLNDVIDSHSRRVTIGLGHRIPGAIWLALWFVMTLAMATVGYSFGVSSSHAVLVGLMLTLAFSSVVVVIAALDRSVTGAISVDQQPMVDLKLKLSEPR